MAGQVGIAGHLKIGDNAIIGAQSGVASDVPEQTTVMGSPAMPAGQTKRAWAVMAKLPELAARVRRLEGQVEELAADGTGRTGDPKQQP
jgi:UDP-3-O-[3-hydroxymyristoyl] glucosamine N-acyltransferase